MSLVNDTEKSRWVCRIMAITFRIAKSLPPETISRAWVAKYLKRSEKFVSRNWHKDPFSCEMENEPKTGTIILSQESQDIITSTLAREKKSIRTLQKDIEDIRGKRKSTGAIFNFLHSIGAKPFHQIAGPKTSAKNVDDRLWFCEYLKDWDEDEWRMCFGSPIRFLNICRPNKCCTTPKTPRFIFSVTIAKTYLCLN